MCFCRMTVFYITKIMHGKHRVFPCVSLLCEQADCPVNAEVFHSGIVRLGDGFTRSFGKSKSDIQNLFSRLWSVNRMSLQSRIKYSKY